MVAILAIAYGLDRWVLFLREAISRGELFAQWVLLSYSLGHLLLAVLLLALFVWMVLRAQVGRWIAWAYLITGLAISLYPAVYLRPSGSCCAWIGFRSSTHARFSSLPEPFLR